jgi:thiol:disulfide interchange protein
VYENTVEVVVPITAGADTAASAKLNGSVRYQACNDQACLFPTTAKFSVAQDATSGVAATETAAPDSATAAPTSESANAFAERLRRQYRVVGIPDIVFLDGNGQERKDLRSGEELTRKVMIEKSGAGEWRA